MKKLSPIVLPLFFISIGSSQKLSEVIETYKNGNIASITYHKKTRNGIEKVEKDEYYENGKKRSKETYKGGKLDGFYTKWFDNGQKEIDGAFINGKQNGLWTFWYENGQMLSQGSWIVGIRDGLINEWYENGQKKLKMNYEDGKENGLRTQWYDNGQKEMEGTYKDGKKVSLWIEWNVGGKKSTETTFVGNDKYNKNTYYDSDSPYSYCIAEYLNGNRHGSNICFDEKDRMTMYHEYINGIPEGFMFGDGHTPNQWHTEPEKAIRWLEEWHEAGYFSKDALNRKISYIKNKEEMSKIEWHRDGNSKHSEVAIITTEYGEMVIKFFEEKAPKHVESFKLHVKNGYYDGTIFHRVIPGFMIQGGDPNTKGDNNTSFGTGGHAAKYFGMGNEADLSTWTLPAEFNDIKHELGIVSMARANDPNSAGSQFFICAANVPHLDGKYTVFGQVVEGLEIIQQIVNQPRDSRDNPNRRIVIKANLK